MMGQNANREGHGQSSDASKTKRRKRRRKMRKRQDRIEERMAAFEMSLSRLGIVDPEIARLVGSDATGERGAADLVEGAGDPVEGAADPVAAHTNVVPGRRGILAAYASMTSRLLGFTSARADLNTGTYSLYAVSVAVDPSASAMRKLFIPLSNLFLVFSQGMALWAMGNEAGLPPCNAITDCPAGMFCQVIAIARSRKRPLFRNSHVCRDCGELCTTFHSERSDETCSKIIDDGIWANTWKQTDADYNELPLGKDAKWTETYEKGMVEWDKYECLAANHCNATDMDTKTCDYVTQNYEKMDPITWFVIALLTLLWIIPICQDVEEAAVEEIILNFHLKTPLQDVRAIRNLNVPAVLVLIALRVRKFMFPFLTTQATVILLVTDVLTAKNMVLNFLAVTFIMEADNVVVFFVDGGCKKRMETMANGVDAESKEATRKTFFWTKAQGLVCAVLLIMGIILMRHNRCDQVFGVMIGWVSRPVWAIMVMHTLQVCCQKRVNQTCCNRILAGLIDLSLNSMAWICCLHLPVLTLATTGATTPFLNHDEPTGEHQWCN